MRTQRVSTAQIAGILALSAGLAALYGPTLIRLAADWRSEPDYWPTVLLPLLAAAMLWSRRAPIGAAAARPSWMGLAVLSGAVLLHVAASVAAEFFSARLSFLAALAGLVLLFFGWAKLRQLLLPMTVLALAIPVPAIVQTQIARPIEGIAAPLSVWVLSMFGQTVVLQGGLLTLPQGILGVDSICGGLRSLTALAAVSLALGSFGRLNRGARLLLLAATLPALLIATTLRICAAALLFSGSSAPSPGQNRNALLSLISFALAAGLLTVLHTHYRRLARVRQEAAHG